MVEIVRVAVTEPPAFKVTLAVSFAVVPLPTTGETDVVRVTVPVKPLKLVDVIEEVRDEPCTIAREVGPALMTKVGRLAKVAVCMFSGFAPAESATVTQNGGLLDCAHCDGLET
jgi:hypothetical protein